jgi:hypothetical protein
MYRESDSFVFQRVTGGLRKPILRFRLANGRQIELLGFHLEPAWAFGREEPRPNVEKVLRRLYPHEKPVVITEPEHYEGSAFLCVAYLYSDSPAKKKGSTLDYSVLLVCGLVADIDKGVRGIVSELLSKVDWESAATDDSMW